MERIISGNPFPEAYQRNAMIIIRPEQKAALAAVRDGEFVARMCIHCRTMFPDATAAMSDEALADTVRERIATARGYGLSTSRDLCRFLNMSAVHGWDFEQWPQNRWMHDMLADTDIDAPSNRLHRLIRACSEREAIRKHNAALRSSFIMEEE